MIDVLFERVANKLSNSELGRWAELFPTFANAFAAMGCPYQGMIGIVDGNFMQICWPLGKGNPISTLDQQEFYGTEKTHGIMFLAAVLSNGIICIYGPSRSRCHNGFLMNSSGWLQAIVHFKMLEFDLV